MKYYLGVDGGGTKTAFMLADEKGRVMAECTKKSSNYLQCGIDGLKEVISSGKDEILKMTGISEDEIENAFLGCPAYGDIKTDCPMIEGAIKESLGSIPFKVGNDCENALAGALDGKEGINIIAGTGSMSCGYNERTGRMLRCGGWHHAIGSDEGSGYWIAWNLLKEFTRQSDGRDKKTLLYEAVKERLKVGEDDGEVITRVVDEWKLDRTKVASISTLITDLYDRNDPYAIRIVRLAAEELYELAAALKKRLEFEEDEIISVSGTGGVFKLQERLIDSLSDFLAKGRMVFSPPVHDPIYGSVILAMKGRH